MKHMLKPIIQIATDHDDWENLDYRTIVEAVAQETLSSFEYANQVEISLLLTNDDHIQKLNSEHRGQNKPTNVLSFPNHDAEELEKLLYQPYINENHPIVLGDIALAFETISREAEEQSKAFDHHLAHLVAHGLLHLLGYDHLVDEDAEEMEGLEVKILTGLSIENPYKE